MPDSLDQLRRENEMLRTVVDLLEAEAKGLTATIQKLRAKVAYLELRKSQVTDDVVSDEVPEQSKQ